MFIFAELEELQAKIKACELPLREARRFMVNSDADDAEAQLTDALRSLGWVAGSIERAAEEYRKQLEREEVEV